MTGVIYLAQIYLSESDFLSMVNFSQLNHKNSYLHLESIRNGRIFNSGIKLLM